MTPKWIEISAGKRALLLLLLFTLLTHLPSGRQPFTADDYLNWAMVQGSPALHALGFSQANPDKPFVDRLRDGFHFFDPGQDSQATYRQYGNFPWWGADSARMVPFRPLAAASHGLDYRLFGSRIHLHRLHSLLYFLLLAAAVFAFFRRFETGSAVPWLATALLIADFSLTRSYLWVIARNSYLALALGTLALLAFVRWREQGHARHLLAALVALLLALLSAEAAVAVLAYMGAYVLCLERHPSLLHKIPPLLPFIALVILWRIGYSSAGFGSQDIGQYVDPGRSPLTFASNLLTVLPLIGLSQISGIDSLSLMIDPARRGMLIALGGLVTLGSLLWILPLLKTRPTTRFMLVGSVVAAIPGTALISGESRTVTFVSLGFFFVLAQWLAGLWNRAGGWRRGLAGLVLVWHLLLPALAALVFTAGLIPFAPRSNQYENVQPLLESGRRSLVILNDPHGLFYYLPFEWAFHGRRLPDNINLLTPGLARFRLTRTGDREYRLDIPAGLPVHHEAPLRARNSQPPLFSPAYSTLFALGFFTSPAQAPRVNDHIQRGDMRVDVLAENAVGPTRLHVQFTGPVHPDAKIWQWYDWKNHRYQTMENLKIGESREIPALLDP